MVAEGDLGEVGLQHACVDLLAFTQEDAAEAFEVADTVPLAIGVEIGRGNSGPGMMAVGEPRAQPGPETPARPQDNHIGE